MLGNNLTIERENAQKTTTIVFMGDSGSGKSTLRNILSPITNKESALQFSYVATDTFKVLAYELKDKILLDLILKKDVLDSSVIVISIDLSKPENIIKSLTNYIRILRSYIQGTDPERDSMKSKVLWSNYSQYLDPEGNPRENRLNLSFDDSAMGHASSLNFGLKMVVVGTKSESLMADSDLMDFMHQSLRSICLLFGMPLIYVSQEIDATIIRFREYLLHYSFSHIYSLNSTIRNDDWGFPSIPEYLEREKTFIPAGWDTVEMIESFSDQTRYSTSEYFSRKDSLLEWIDEYYSKNFPTIVQTPVEFIPVKEQEFLEKFSRLNATDTVIEAEPARIPVKINSLASSSGSAQNEVLSNFFKSLLAKKG